MLTTLGPPLARALLSQTQFLTRPRLFLAAVPSNAVDPLLALQHTIDTICDRARVLKHCTTSSLQLKVTGPVGILIRTDGSSPSNVSLAAESGTPNTACTLIDVARSTSACDVELSSIDDGFESLVATKNTPPLKVTASSFQLFWQSNVGPS